MAKQDGDAGSWDKVEASQSFQEQIGKPQGEADLSGDMGATESAEATDRLSMPNEPLAADGMDGFREQLPSQDGAPSDTRIDSTQMTGDEFTAAAQEQIEDDAS